MSQTESQGDDPNSIPEIGLVSRHQWQLRMLPPKWRWEAVRRHPYYQTFWRPANDHFQQRELEPKHLEIGTYKRQAAVSVLQIVGVTAVAPDPALEFEQLDQDGEQAGWLSGAVHPITFLGMVGQMMATMPAETLTLIGNVLTEAGHFEEPGMRSPSFMRLQCSDDPALASYPDLPIVSICPASSQREITRCLIELQKGWQARCGIEDKRVNLEKLPKYFEVFDLREGWSQGSYRQASELRFEEICAQLNCPISTAHNFYRNAFLQVVGQPFTSPLWARVFGPSKLSQLLAPGNPGRVVRRRPLQQRSPVAAPETRVGVNVAMEPAHYDRSAQQIAQIQELIRAGMSDQEICDTLEMEDEILRGIAELRRRFRDLPSGT